MKRLLIIIFLLIGCGSIDVETPAEKEKKHQNETTRKLTGLQLQGYISPIFEISVDGESYFDSEEFYTIQLERFEDEMHEAGYGDYQLVMDAQLGLDDWKRGMTVYAVSIDDRGYAGEQVLNHSGSFTFQFPIEADGDIFQVRANERIGLKLIGPTETKYWCFNFFTNEQVQAI